MLESHHALVVKALQQLYAHCINNKCFPGEPIDSVDGYPLTHAILDRLGLIKEAEESTSDALDDDATEALRYWKFHRRSSSSADTEDTSSVQTSPIEQSPVSESGSGSSASEPNGMNGDHSFARLQDAYTPYGPYPCADEQLWSMAATPASPLAMDFNQTIATTGLHAGSRYLPAHVSDPTKIAHQDPSIPSSSVRNPSMIVPSGSCQPPSFHQLYTVAPVFSYQHPNDGLSGADQQDVWAPNPWNRSKNGQNSNLGRP
ncbi:hypothetical protein PRK78_000259 [Emydomyces testavorans]|uniref:Uncharacterized protein n=1 Tax=Emydomyces testavorans TaxID=2070801 RepID=A0AAF0DAD4_9EURO|nr:hypothetical protein PRK78_000259 [Emydomyces testavorans]